MVIIMKDGLHDFFQAGKLYVWPEGKAAATQACRQESRLDDCHAGALALWLEDSPARKRVSRLSAKRERLPA
jgi:hypothetical protein